MRKLSTSEMGRLTVEEYKRSDKLPLTVVIDNVRSQHNIGSIFRTSDAFRVERICICGISSTPPHREIHKTALGAEESVEWQHYESTEECVAMLKKEGYKVFAVEQAEGSESPEKIEFQGKTAIVFGNEVEGVGDKVMEMVDGCIEIPQYGTKHSLNVSCAAAIVIWEVAKRWSEVSNQ